MQKITTILKHFCCICLFLISNNLLAQNFIGTLTASTDLGVGTDYSACATPGTKRATFTISGLPNSLSSTFALSEFKFKINIPNTSNDDVAHLNLYLKSPTGVCIKIFNPANVLDVSYGVGNWTFIVKDRSSATCLDLPDEANFGYNAINPAADGNAGVCGVQALTTTFSGINPNGTWELYASCAGQTDMPTLISASMSFADPVALSYTTSAADGKNCANAILWSGVPTCAATFNRTNADARGEIETPGSNTGDSDVTLSTFANGTCSWNASADNTTWVKFIAQEANVCIGISGLSDNQQSIVVTNPLGNGSACPANGEGWNVVNCPNTAIYSGTAGTTLNQNHCFTAIPGNTYYLVIDGTGGLTSSFYIYGTGGFCTGKVVLTPTTISSQDYCGADWTYYLDAAGNKIFGIQWDPTNKRQNGFPNWNKSTQNNAKVTITVGSLMSADNGGAGNAFRGQYVAKRYWNIDPITGSLVALDGNVNVRFFYDSAEKTTATSTAQAAVNNHTGTSLIPFYWFKTVGNSFESSDITATGISSGIVLTDINATAQTTIDNVLYAQFNDVASFSGGGGAAGVGAPLPVELLDFTGHLQDKKVRLTWTTATEKNNDYFVVERSSDAKNFTSISKYIKGGGTSNTPLYYTEIDENPLKGMNYYRLKQIDFDGKYEYSPIVSVQKGNNSVLTIQPNPSTGIFEIIGLEATDDATISVFDATGKLLFSQSSPKIDLTNYPNSVYYIHLTGDDNAIVKRIVKI